MKIFLKKHIDKCAKREYNQTEERNMRILGGERVRIAEYNEPAAKNIARIIKDKGLKQTYVAFKAGYTTQELSDMLNGRKLIKVCDIPRIAKVLGVKSDDIYEAGREEVERDD